MSKPYLWVYESPGHFNPHDGGEPPYTDFSDVEKPGYFPLYRDDLRAELVKIITACRDQIDHIIEDGAPTDWHMWRDDLSKLIAKAEGRPSDKPSLIRELNDDTPITGFEFALGPVEDRR